MRLKVNFMLMLFTRKVIFCSDSKQCLPNKFCCWQKIILISGQFVVQTIYCFISYVYILSTFLGIDLYYQKNDHCFYISFWFFYSQTHNFSRNSNFEFEKKKNIYIELGCVLWTFFCNCIIVYVTGCSVF